MILSLPEKKVIFSFFIGIQALGILFLVYSIINAKHRGSVLGAHVTPIRRDDYVFTVIDNNRVFWEHKGGGIETATTDWLDYTAVYTINDDGLNSAKNYTIEKPPDTVRIMTIGDSFTFGAWVNTADNFPSRLEALLQKKSAGGKKYEVLNLGESAYDVDFMIRRYELRGKKYNPDIIVMLLCECDFTELAGVMDRMVDKHAYALLRTGNITNTMARKAQAIKEAHDDLIRMTDNRIEAYQLEKLQEFLKSVDRPVLLLTDDSTSPRGVLELRTMTTLRSDIYFSILPAFDRLPDMHPSAEGYRQIAEDIYGDLLRFSIIAVH